MYLAIAQIQATAFMTVIAVHPKARAVIDKLLHTWKIILPELMFRGNDIIYLPLNSSVVVLTKPCTMTSQQVLHWSCS